ncbi:hypothetical protein J7T55_001557 [Diaporthe amygdali]|uniref:uncharacterized protein n=1 Tax=Phomopsis amygdali TaxID=1214568 RepID=UPI0022FDE17A|nr:uncharacterized protein J7T55_001557 [Diaporthe amygdali]KAJ0115148.1 hypothetical protein J7T55_001557 [Diaporthe amygdali]
MDPATITKLTLSGISAFSSTVKFCTEAYNAYRLSEEFGTDWVKVQRRLFIQYTKFAKLSEAPIHWFRGNLWNPEDDLSRAVKMQLIDIESHFKQCHDLMKKYESEDESMTDMAIEADPSHTQHLEPTIQQEEAQGSLAVKGSYGTTKKEAQKPHGLRKLVFWGKTKGKVERRPDSSKSVGTETASTSTLSTGGSLPRTDATSSKDVTSPGTSLFQTEADEEVTVPSQGSRIIPKFVTQGMQEVSDQAVEKQSTAGKYNRVRWVHYDRENFLKAIDDIERCNTQLDSLLQLHGVSDPADVLGVTDRGQPDQMERTKQIQGNLRRLHSALVNSNPAQVKSATQVFFTIQVNEDPEGLSEELVEIDDKLPIYSSQSSVSALHAHISGLQAEPSVLLYASTRHIRNEADTLPNAPDEVENLHTKLRSLAETTKRGDYEVVGTALSTGHPRDSHVLICHSSGPWYVTKSLKEFLSDASYTESLSVAQRLSVARLMTLSFLYFGHLSRTTDKYPRPENVLFYELRKTPSAHSDTVTASAGSEESSHEDNAQPEAYILNPYLAIGLGRKKHKIGGQPLGATSGLARRTVNPVAELGLVLFQVGTGTAVEYGSGAEGFRRAARHARLSLYELVSSCGPGFAELVGLCLDKGEDVFAPVTDADDRFMEDLRGWFRRKEETSIE